jgi:hypothetical protein
MLINIIQLYLVSQKIEKGEFKAISIQLKKLSSFLTKKKKKNMIKICADMIQNYTTACMKSDN